MRLAVLADIHSNLAALESVLADVAAWKPDRIIVAGDIINRGPNPRECLETVLDLQARGAYVLRGNHEDFVLFAAQPPRPLAAWEQDVYRHSAWTLERTRDLLPVIESLPHRIEFDGPNGETIRSVHASMHGNRQGLYEHMDEATMHPLIEPAPSLLCVGHTHVPFVREWKSTLVVNVGAVGLPFDRDPRAAYARVTRTGAGWQADIVRLDYARDRTLRDYLDTGYDPNGGPMVALIRDELLNARPRLSHWHRLYEQAVSDGRITVPESVAEMLAGGS